MDAEDEEGDTVSWAIDIDGDGVAEGDGPSLPATYSHVFSEPGEFVVNVTASDGEFEAAASVNVTVLAPAWAAQSLEGAIVGNSPGCVEGTPYDASGSGFVEVTVDAGTVGHPYFVDFRSGSAIDAFLILDAAGTELVRKDLGAWEAGVIRSGVWSASGTVPVAAATLVFLACDNVFGNPVSGAPEEYHYEAGKEAERNPF